MAPSGSWQTYQPSQRSCIHFFSFRPASLTRVPYLTKLSLGQKHAQRTLSSPTCQSYDIGCSRRCSTSFHESELKPCFSDLLHIRALYWALSQVARVAHYCTSAIWKRSLHRDSALYNRTASSTSASPDDGGHRSSKPVIAIHVKYVAANNSTA